jgi:hypothetical protein
MENNKNENQPEIQRRRPPVYDHVILVGILLTILQLQHLLKTGWLYTFIIFLSCTLGELILQEARFRMER